MQCEQEEINMSSLLNALMSSQSNRGLFDRVNLDGRNVGSSMSIRHGRTGGTRDCCSVNVYITNNIHGVDNSILVGSEVTMRDPGLSLSLRDLNLDRGVLDTNQERMNKDLLGLKLGLLGIFFLILSSILLSWSLI